MPGYNELITRHQELKKQLDDRQTLEIEPVLEFIKQARDAGSHINNPNQREELRIILREWGAFVYDQTKEFPATQLMPYEYQHRKPSADTEVKRRSLLEQNKWLLLGILLGIIFSISIIFLVWGNLLPISVTPTAIPCPLESLRPFIKGPEVTDLKAEINFPKHCSTDLPSAEPVRSGGFYTGELKGREIWVLVFASDTKYYPQYVDSCKLLQTELKSDTWETNLFLGQKGTPEQFDIIVGVTDVDSESNQLFKDWLRTGCETQEYPGFETIPNDFSELDAITVMTTG